MPFRDEPTKVVLSGWAGRDPRELGWPVARRATDGHLLGRRLARRVRGRLLLLRHVDDNAEGVVGPLHLHLALPRQERAELVDEGLLLLRRVLVAKRRHAHAERRPLCQVGR